MKFVLIRSIREYVQRSKFCGFYIYIYIYIIILRPIVMKIHKYKICIQQEYNGIFATFQFLRRLLYIYIYIYYNFIANCDEDTQI